MYNEFSPRNDFIDIVKGVLITLVCVGHANQYAILHNREFWHDPLFKAIYMFHMPLFMAVAGYISFRGISTTPSLTKYVKRRSISYLLPIFTWAIICQVAVYTLSGHATIETLHYEIIYKAINHLWFLWALLVSIALTAIANSTGKYRLFVLVLLFIVTLVLPEKGSIYLFKYTFPFFVSGFYCATFDFSRIEFTNLKRLTVILALGSCLCFIFWEKNTYVYITKMTISMDNLWNIFYRWIAGIVVSTFIVLLLLRCSSSIPDKIKKMLIDAGRESIYIYILQNFGFLLISRSNIPVFQPNSNIILGDFISIVIGLLITYICLWIARLISNYKYVAMIFFGKIKNHVLVAPEDSKF